MSDAIAYVTQVLYEDGEAPMVPTRLFTAHVEGPGELMQDAPSAGPVDEMLAWARERAEHVVVTAVSNGQVGRYSAGTSVPPWDQSLPRWADVRWIAPKADADREREALAGQSEGTEGEDIAPPPAAPAPPGEGAAIVIQQADAANRDDVRLESTFQADFITARDETVNGPAHASLAQALSWARAHARVVVLLIDVDGDLRAYSAGDEPADWTAAPPPIEGLPAGPLPPWPALP